MMKDQAMQIKKTSLSLNRNQKGYLLIEAMISMAIFAIGFLAVGTMVIKTTQNNTRSNIMTQATLLATQTLENFKSTPYITDLADGEAYTDPAPVDQWGNPGGIFTRSWTISDPIGYDTSRQIEVGVSWTRRGHQRNIVLTTITRGRGN
jgi:type II secretory pathway pseudopilin PulG